MSTEPSTPSQPTDSRTDFAEHLITLITNQDHISQAWLRHLVTIQAGLAVALGFILKPGDGAAGQSLSHLAVFAIPFVGIAAAVALTIVIVRERKWQSWYVQQYTSLSGPLPRVFPAHRGSVDSVGQQPIGFISRVIICFCAILLIGWSTVLCSLLWHPPVAHVSSSTTAIQAPTNSP